MIIKSFKFVTSVASSENLIKDGLPQIAFVGRSNVGKSSLINFLLGNKKIARTSSTPGRTRLVNYFLVNDSFYFVDLPGYGFAKGNKKENMSWEDLIEPYLTNNENLKCVCFLVDGEILPTELDLQMQVVLNYYRLPYIIIATKTDKIKRSIINKNKESVANKLSLGMDNVIMCSSKDNIGRTEIINKISHYLEG